MAQASAASRDVGSGGTSLRVRVQRFGSFLSGMVMPNIGVLGAGPIITSVSNALGAAVDALVAILSEEEEE